MKNSALPLILSAFLVLASAGCHDTLLAPTKSNGNDSGPLLGPIVYNTPSMEVVDGPPGYVVITDTSGIPQISIGLGHLGSVAGSNVVWSQVDTTRPMRGIQDAQVAVRAISYRTGSISVTGQNYLVGSGRQLVGAPAVTTDGRHIAYIATDSLGTTALWVMDNTGGTRTFIADHVFSACTPVFSRDGSSIAYEVVSDYGLVAYVAFSSIDGKVSEELPYATELSDSANISWRKDSRAIAFTSGGNVIIYPFDTKKILFAGPGFAPCWSPVSNSLVFLSPDRDIMKYEDNALTVQNLTNTHSNDRAFPQWSPDGKWILYTSGTADFFSRKVLKIIKPDGTGDRTIMKQDGVHAFWLQ